MTESIDEAVRRLCELPEGVQGVVTAMPAPLPPNDIMVNLREAAKRVDQAPYVVTEYWFE